MSSILVIDDDQQIRTFLRRTLEPAGYEVFEAKDGREGVDLYRANPTDLVITDLLMPDTDGLETTYVLTRDFPNAKIIAITGEGGDRNFLDVAKRFGAHQTLTKPFSVKELLETVKQELSG